MQQLAERWARLGHRPFVLTRTLAGSNRQEIVNGLEINRVIRTAAVGPAFGATFIASLSTQLVRRARRFDVMVAGQLPWESVATGISSRVLRKPSVAFAASNGPNGDVQQILAARGGCIQHEDIADFTGGRKRGSDLRGLGMRHGGEIRGASLARGGPEVEPGRLG